MSEEPINQRLLQAAFSKDEWDLLLKDPVFGYLLSKDDGTLAAYERMVDIGLLLLRRWKDRPDKSGAILS